MTKETIQKCSDLLNTDGINSKEQVKKILQGELESIENAKPSEALDIFSKVDNVRLLFTNEERNIIKQALLKAQKEHNSTNLLMQELDCKDFAELRKYARCGYEKLNKKYLKWEDLEFKKEEQTIKVLLNGERYLVKYVNEWFCGWCNRVQITNGIYTLCTLGNGMKQFFNDLHLERVEE